MGWMMRKGTVKRREEIEKDDNSKERRFSLDH